MAWLAGCNLQRLRTSASPSGSSLGFSLFRISVPRLQFGTYLPLECQFPAQPEPHAAGGHPTGQPCSELIQPDSSQLQVGVPLALSTTHPYAGQGNLDPQITLALPFHNARLARPTGRAIEGDSIFRQLRARPGIPSLSPLSSQAHWSSRFVDLTFEREGLGFSLRCYASRAKAKISPGGEPLKKKKKRKPSEVRTAPADAPYVPSASSTANPVLKEVVIPERVTSRQLASLLGVRLPAIEVAIGTLGETPSSADDFLTADTAELVAMEFGRAVRRERRRGFELRGVSSAAPDGEREKWLPRPAVIAVMGHVDHGKTSLLDALRSTSVAAGEAGGITQHMGAFVVGMTSGARLTFLDTPGHAAFAAMRARGAAVTDIVVLVVAADDGVMPQTIEAIQHARSAGVPLVVAINKCDKPDAQPQRVRQQLLAQGLELEEVGGDTQVVEISATAKQGLQELEECLLLQAELMDLRARTAGDAEGVVVEARMDRGQGPLATIIVNHGTLKTGDFVIVGAHWGRVRSLRDFAGCHLDEAGPSLPAEICGLRGMPEAGDDVLVVASEERARRISAARQLAFEQRRLQALGDRMALRNLAAPSGSAAGTAGDRKASAEEGDKEQEQEEEEEAPTEVSVVLKADVQGTVEAVKGALEALSGPKVAVTVVHAGVGPISQSDVAFAEAIDAACLVGFNLKPLSGALAAAAERAQVKVQQHRVIYHLLQEVGSVITNCCPGTREMAISGQAQILQLFEVKGKGREAIIAGCRVTEGRLLRSCAHVRVVRSGEVVYEGRCGTLRREKADVDTVPAGAECGATVEGWRDLRIGDSLHFVEEIVKPLRLVASSNGSMRIEA